MSELLQNYIIRYQYQSDEASRTSLLSSLGSTAATVSKIASGALITAGILVKAQHSIASSINSLYLTAHNMGGSTIRTLKSITEAAKDVGDSVEGMTSSLAGLNKFQKTMGPGAAQLISQFGGKFYKQGMGAPESALAIAQNVPTLKAEGMDGPSFYAATETMGIAFESAQAMWENNTEFLKQQEAHSGALGTKVDALGDGIHSSLERFGVDMDKALNAGAKAFGDTFQTAIDAELTGFEHLLKGFDDNAEEMNNILNHFTTDLELSFDKLGSKFDGLGASLSGIDKSLGVLSSPLEFIKNHWEMLALAPTAMLALVRAGMGKGIGGAILGNMTKSIGKAIASNLGTLGIAGIDGTAIAATLGTGLSVIGSLGLGAFAGRALDKEFKLSNKIADYAWNLTQNPPELIQNFEKFSQKGRISKEEGSRLSAGMQFLLQTGMTRNETLGTLANLKGESHLDPFASGDSDKAYGIGQWHDKRQKLYEERFGHSMQSVSDRNEAFIEQMKFVDWERKNNEKAGWAKVHNAPDTPFDKAAAYSQFIERPGAVYEAAQVRGNMAEGLNASPLTNVTINVNGAQNPEAIAAAVKNQLQDINKQGQRYNSPSYQ
jgi:hypothetical protein